jgi:hypothetical protein
MVLSTGRDASKANDFVKMMKQVGPQMGIHIRDPHLITLLNDRVETYLKSIKENLNNTVRITDTGTFSLSHCFWVIHSNFVLKDFMPNVKTLGNSSNCARHPVQSWTKWPPLNILFQTSIFHAF